MTPPRIEPALLSFNYRSGRSGPYPVDLIVIHCTEGDADSVVSWFNNRTAEVSAHYLVCKDGRVLQFVHEENTAWHAGRVVDPTAALVIARADTNPNSYSVGIEHETNGHEPLTPVQLAASLSLIADIAARRGIPIDRTHIVGHHEIYAPKTCPGGIDVDWLVRALNVTEPAPRPVADRPAPPRVVWSDYLNDYLLVVEEIDDGHWSFQQWADVRALPGHRATTPLSQMPTVAT